MRNRINLLTLILTATLSTSSLATDKDRVDLTLSEIQNKTQKEVSITTFDPQFQIILSNVDKEYEKGPIFEPDLVPEYYELLAEHLVPFLKESKLNTQSISELQHIKDFYKEFDAKNLSGLNESKIDTALESVKSDYLIGLISEENKLDLKKFLFDTANLVKNIAQENQTDMEAQTLALLFFCALEDQNYWGLIGFGVRIFLPYKMACNYLLQQSLKK